MISCAVEPSLSSTVTSINDPLCTVLAANLLEKRETFYHEGEKETAKIQIGLKWLFFPNNLLHVPYCRKPKAKHSSGKKKKKKNQEIAQHHAYNKQVILVHL